MQTENPTITPADDQNTIDGGITVVTEQFQALVNIDAPEFVAQVFSPFRKELATLKRRVAREGDYDIKTVVGMATAKELRKAFGKIRTTAENVRKERKAPIVEIGKLLDSEYKALEAAVREHEDKHAQAIDAELQRQADEQARKLAEQRARTEEIEGRIAQIRSLPVLLREAPSDKIMEKLDELVALRLLPGDYDDQLEDALTAKNEAEDALRALHQVALEREAEARRVQAEREELARMRADQAERDRIAAEQAQQQAAAAAAVQRQQQQMNDIMQIQNLGTEAATMASQDAVALALNKVDAFNPAHYGSMAPMAEMARSMAQKALEARLEELPAPEPEPAPANSAEFFAHYTETPVGTKLSFHPEPMAQAEPAPRAPYPTDEQIAQVVANEFSLSLSEAITRLSKIDFEALALVA